MNRTELDQQGVETINALETLGMLFAEMALHRISQLGLTDNPDTNLSLRALGSVSGRLAMSRLANDNSNAGATLEPILAWLLQWDITNPDAPPTLKPPTAPPPTVELALIDLWDRARHVDNELHARGFSGPSTLQRAARGVA